MKRISYVIFCVLLLCYFFSYQSILSHVLFYHEQHHLFLFSEAYFNRTLASEGLLSYFTNFIIQFFYIPLLGSAILAFLVAAVYIFTNNLIHKILGKVDVLQLSVIPSIYLFFYTMTIDHSLNVVVGYFLFFLLLNLLLIVIRRFWKNRPEIDWAGVKNKKIKLIITCVCFALYTGAGYFYFINKFNTSERILLRIEQLAKNKDWEQVLKYTYNYQMSGRTNQLVSYFHNLSLFKTGQLSSRLFEFPQSLGVKSLYFPWNSDSRESEYGHFVYEELGYLNEAHRWEFEAMVVWGETAPHLLNLAKYNIANDRPLVAKRFIELLKQSLFYKKQALELEPIMYSGQVPGLRNALKGIEDAPARFSNILNIGPELQYICANDSTNKMAFEYLMSNLLLSNQVVRFVDNLKFIHNYSYSSLPPIYEEALYIYKLGVSEDEFNEVGFTVSTETVKKFADYYQLMKKGQIEALRARFGKTYWFYLNYVSPYGNKVIQN